MEVTLKPDSQTVTQLWQLSPPEILGPISTNSVKPEEMQNIKQHIHISVTSVAILLCV